MLMALVFVCGAGLSVPGMTHRAKLWMGVLAIAVIALTVTTSAVTSVEQFFCTTLRAPV
jgi:hypothetical protein